MATLSRRVPRSLLQTSPVQLRSYASLSGFKRKTGVSNGEGASDGPGEQPTARRRRDTASIPSNAGFAADSPALSPGPSQSTQPPTLPSSKKAITFTSSFPDLCFNPPYIILQETITPAVASQALEFSRTDKNPFRIFGLPRNLLVEFRILSTPCSVVRGVTIDVANRLDVASQVSSADHRLVFTGATGCGKSVLLLQALQYCYLRDWIIFYFPRAINLVDSTTTYAYDPRTRLYQQATFTFQTLRRFLTVNNHRLNRLRTTADVELERRATIPAGTTLSDLARAGIKERALASTILTALMEELEKQTEFPVLLAIDDFQAIYCKTKYRDPHFSTIKPYHLSIPRLLLEFASGQRHFERGAVLGAISTTNAEFRLPLELAEALGIPPISYGGPYVKRCPTLQSYAQGLERIAVPDALTVPEAMEVFDLWSKDDAIPSVPTDELFLSKYSESCGNAREFVWKGLLSSLSM